MTVLCRRANGTFVITHPLSGLPYHVMQGDPLFDVFHEEALQAPLEALPDIGPPAPPATISDRQFFQQLVVAGLIGPEDALAAVRTGTLPQPLQTVVNNLPDDVRFGAEMLLCGATQFERHHPLTDQLGSSLGWSPEQIDQFWREAYQL